MKRISVSEVLEAYAKTGLKPVRGGWCSDGCACGLGVLFIASGRPPSDAYSERIYRQLGIEPEYGSGFIVGFDGEIMDEKHPVALQGYLDGRAAAAAVFGEVK